MSAYGVGRVEKTLSDLLQQSDLGSIGVRVEGLVLFLLDLRLRLRCGQSRERLSAEG